MKRKYLFLMNLAVCIAFCLTQCREPIEPEPEPEATGNDTTKVVLNPTIIEAKFRVVNDSCEAPCIVEFINESLEATNYTWNFGDGSQEVSEESPVHNYVSGGEFNVTLIASADTGDPDTAVEAIFIDTKPDPIACFEITEISNNGFVPSTIRISNCSQYASSFIWDFGDGFTATDQEVGSHEYLSPGIFKISLEVSDELGNSESQVKSVEIKQVPTFFNTYELVAISAHDEAWDLIESSNQELIAAGKVYLSPGILIADQNGNEIIEKQVENLSGVIKSIKESRWGDFLISGDCFIGKIDINGNVIWAKETTFEYNDLVEDLSGNIYFVGRKCNENGKMYISKYDGDGNWIWDRDYFKGFLISEGFSITISNDGSIFASGYTGFGFEAGAAYRPYITKIDDAGNEIDYFNLTNRSGSFASITTSIDGGLFALGSIYSVSTGNVVTVMKLDNSLNKIWEKSFNSISNVEANDIIQLRDGRLVVVGTSDVDSDNPDVYLLILDENGEMISEQELGQSNRQEEGRAVIEAYDGGIVIAGGSRGSMLLIKTDAFGNLN